MPLSCPPAEHLTWQSSLGLRVLREEEGKFVPDYRSVGLSQDEAFTCCLVKSKAESPTMEDGREALLFISKREVLRPGWTTAASPRVLESGRALHCGDHLGSHCLWLL